MLKIGVAVSLKSVARVIHEMLMGYAEIIFFDEPDELIDHLSNENLNLLIIDRTFKNRSFEEIIEEISVYPPIILLTSDSFKKRKDFNINLILRRPFHVYELRESVNFVLTDKIYNKKFLNKIMIVDDSAVTRNILKQELTILGFEIIEAENGKQALEIIKSPENTPFLFIIDQEMPEMNGIELAKNIRNLDMLHDIPIIMFTSLFDNMKLRKEAFNVGINDFIPKPFKKEDFQATIKKYTEFQADESSSKILLLTPTISKSKAISSILKNCGYRVFSSDKKDKFITLLEDNEFNLAIVDLKSIENDIDNFVNNIKKVLPAGFPVIAYLPVEDFNLKDKLFKTLKGYISDYILEPFDVEELTFIVETWLKQYSLINEFIKQKEQLEKLTTFDLLTGVYNRFTILKIGEEQFSLAKRKNIPFSILYLDIDHFKKVNDTYGHSVGDLVLQEFSRKIKDNLRLEDKIGRIGGEEFLVILPYTEKKDALIVAEKLRKNVTEIKIIGYDDLKLSISIGLVSFDSELADNLKTFDQLISLADSLLYKAKESGRNKTVTN